MAIYDHDDDNDDDEEDDKEQPRLVAVSSSSSSTTVVIVLETSRRSTFTVIYRVGRSQSLLRNAIGDDKRQNGRQRIGLD